MNSSAILEITTNGNQWQHLLKGTGCNHGNTLGVSDPLLYPVDPCHVIVGMTTWMVMATIEGQPRAMVMAAKVKRISKMTNSWLNSLFQMSQMSLNTLALRQLAFLSDTKKGYCCMQKKSMTGNTTAHTLKVKSVGIGTREIYTGPSFS